MSNRAFLDFYDTLDKVPVNQLGAGSEYHFQQRSALYRTLGLSPLVIQGHDVLEIGPGSGDNALHIASWQPKSFTLIDGSKAAIKSIAAKIAQGCYGDNTKVLYQDISKQALTEQYDVVLCEGLIPGQQAPDVFLQQVLSAVKPGGVCVFTTVSAASYLAEICRRMVLPTVKRLIAAQEDSTKTSSQTLTKTPSQTLTQALVQLFQPSFNSLKGMSRKPEDWVTDNIIHNWTERGFFSIEDALSSLPSQFSVLGSSPSFIQDWRWYKDSAGSNVSAQIASYHQWSGYLVDYRCNPQAVFPEGAGDKLEQLSQQAMALHDKYRNNSYSSTEDLTALAEFLSVLSTIAENIATILPDTAQAIDDFIIGFEQLRQGNLAADFKCFHHWFGRGQQYLSVIRDK
ncbi:MAG: SAM-dependent methyltransferase [Thalassotalea sp.]